MWLKEISYSIVKIQSPEKYTFLYTSNLVIRQTTALVALNQPRF